MTVKIELLGTIYILGILLWNFVWSGNQKYLYFNKINSKYSVKSSKKLIDV